MTKHIETLPPRAVAILGSGHALPAHQVLSSELDSRLGYPQGHIQRASGVRKRHVASPAETAASLGAAAALRALRAANLDLADIDCVMAASGSMDQGMPCNAAHIHYELGLGDSSVPAFDINASCLGFLAALDTVSWALIGGRYRRVLIVASDIASCGLDWSVLESSAIFGDGAAAAVVGLSGDEHPGSRILSTGLRTYSSGVGLCKITAGGSRFHPNRTQSADRPLMIFEMEGKRVFKLASAHVPGFVDQLLAQAGIARDDLDWIVPHQASHLAMSHLSKRLGFRAEKVIDIFAEYGNQVAASLPTALDVAINDGRIQRGHRLLLLGTGAGLSIGGVVMEY